MTIDDLRRIIEDLPGDTPIRLVDPETAELYEPEFNLEAVRDDQRFIAHPHDGEPRLEALVIS